MAAYYAAQTYQPYRQPSDSYVAGTSSMFGSFSGGGYGSTPPGSCFSIDICPDLLLAALAAAAAAGFVAIFIAITMAGKRRKRSEESQLSILSSISDILNLGNGRFKDFIFLIICYLKAL